MSSHRVPPAHPACYPVALKAEDLRTLDPDQWDALSANAIEHNPFYSRESVLAGIDALGYGEKLEAVAFRLNRDGRLVGLIPFYRERLGRLARFSDGRSALNLYQVGGAPLIDKDEQDAVIECGFEHLRMPQFLPMRWAFAHVELNSHFAQLVRKHAERRGFEVHAISTYKRPILTRLPQGFDAHIDNVIGRKRAKDIQRNIRRLGELGALRFERTSDPALVAQRVEDFLVIEHEGWKGRKGTSFLSKPDHARYARLAFGEAIVDSLLLDEKPIAVSINLRAASTLFTPKCAFDEKYRKFGPGLILEYKVIEAFYADESFDTMNAATTVDGHVISDFWNGERTMGTLIVGPTGWRTRLLAQIESAHHDARKFAKSLLRRFRRAAA